MKHADREQRPQVLREKIPQRDQRRRGRAKGEDGLGSIEPIGEAACRWADCQAHCGANGQHQRDRLRPQVATVEQARKER
jgi:hypothetical protein